MNPRSLIDQSTWTKSKQDCVFLDNKMVCMNNSVLKVLQEINSLRRNFQRLFRDEELAAKNREIKQMKMNSLTILTKRSDKRKQVSRR